MSHRELKKLVHAAEHSSYLRREINDCKTSENIVAMAKKHGFLIELEDLKAINEMEHGKNLFVETSINPLKKIN